jgi:hypothetical protein
MPQPLTRRDCLHVTAGAGAVAAVGPTLGARPSAEVAAAQAAPVPGDALTGWFDKPMRWAQLTLVENDPGQFDLQFWLDYFKRVRADAACLSAGGIVCYYPTEIPLHHRSQWLGASDPFGALVAGCRAMRMHVIARTDPHAVQEEVKTAHPDWISVAADGQPRRHWANPELWVSCALGPYNFDFMDRVHREIVTKYRVDGIFTNRWAPQGGDCYCVHCQANFKAATGLDLPRTNDARNPVRRQFIEWRVARLTELWKRWDASVRAINPDARDHYRTTLRNGSDEPVRVMKFGGFVEVDGQYWLFYSGNWFNQPGYALGIARCDGPLGPCTKPADQPWLASNAQGMGPGEASLFVDDAGWWIVYSPTAVLDPNGTPRPVALAAVDFGPDGPYLAGSRG